MIDRRNKTALVTGASSGMGKEIAKRLIKDGFHVFVAARQVDRMDDLVKLGARALRMDMSSGAEIKAAVETILREVDGIDVQVNNAGFGLYGPVEEVGIDEARYQFEVNLFGAARLTQLLLPRMREKRAGTIVNITSMGGKIYTLLGAWYHATKHALECWSGCLRLELAPFGIKVVIVEPGLIETGFGDGVADGLLKRSGTGPYSRARHGRKRGRCTFWRTMRQRGNFSRRRRVSGTPLSLNGRPTGTDWIDSDRLVWAAEVANAREFIDRMPAGYNTRVGENGLGLSGGQAQRLPIAR